MRNLENGAPEPIVRQGLTRELIESRGRSAPESPFLTLFFTA